MVPLWVQAFFWGLLGGSALLIGAVIAWHWRINPKVVATVMAFGAGVLISALAFDLVDEATQTGGVAARWCGKLDLVICVTG